MVRKNAAFSGHESGAEEIGANFGCAPLQGIHRIAVAIVKRLAVRIDSTVTQGTAGSPVDEGHGHMNETYTWRVSANHRFRGLRFGLHAFQAGSGFLEFLAKRGDFAWFGVRDFLAQLICMLLKLLLLLENIR